MQRILQADILRDVGVFAGAGLALMTFQRYQRAPTYECLANYPRLVSSGFARILNNLQKLQDDQRFQEILELCNTFMEHIATRNNGSDGFVANRLASQIPELIGEMCKQARYSRELEIATRAMDFERDDLDQVRTICDDMIRNMLLESHTYY